ncbi:MAG: hypothetical protein OSA81_02120 [Longimicrobiales bacterium]|nr:hypothetical protein [Longimicrobiales bacterium]
MRLKGIDGTHHARRIVGADRGGRGRQDSGLAGLCGRALTGEDHLRVRAAVALTAIFGSAFPFSGYGWAGNSETFEFDNGFYSVGANA